MIDWRIDEEPGACKALVARAGEIQATFQVPPKQVASFAAAVLSVDPPDTARLVIENMTRPMYALGPVIGRRPEPTLVLDSTVETSGDGCVALLTAALADYVEGWFVPAPGPFMLYLDDDEYVTIFAARVRGISRPSDALRLAGFREVTSYRRKLR